MVSTSPSAASRQPFTDPGATQVVREFLRHTLDLPNREAATALLTRACRDQNLPLTPPDGAPQARYTLGEAVKDGDDVVVPVTVTDGATRHTQTIEVTPVLEDGQWRIDLARTMDRLMGGAMQQLTEQMGEAMKGMGEAMAEGISKAFEALGGEGETGEEEDEEDEGETSSGEPTPESELYRLIDLAREHVLGWQQNLVEELGTPIGWDVDFDGFASNPEMQKNLFGQHILREHGIDHIYYAISNNAKRDPAFKDAFAKRVGMIRLTHVPTPEEKGLSGDGMAIVYRLAIHDGYQGYLTPQELEEQLPAIVAAMHDMAEDVRFGEAEKERRETRKPKRSKAARSASRKPAKQAARTVKKKAAAKRTVKKKTPAKKSKPAPKAKAKRSKAASKSRAKKASRAKASAMRSKPRHGKRR